MQDVLLDKIKSSLLAIDPSRWMEKHLTLDGKPYRLSSNGYKPLADIARTIGLKALEKNSLPIVICKGRQIGMTVLSAALEMYFMGSGIFGNGKNPPIRVAHLFPQIDLAASYSKVKLSSMINNSVQIQTDTKIKGQKPKSYMQNLLDKTSDSNDSLHFKQFNGGNHIFIESVGLDGNRMMGRQLSLDTELPTPSGFIKLSELKEGDKLFDENGKICNVIRLHPINLSPESYKITFDDGTEIEACAEHLWLTYTKQNRTKRTAPIVKNTKEILNSLKIGRENNHSIPCTKPLQYPERELSLDPYLFGLWLGDGDANGRIETADPEILQEYEHRVSPSSINRICSFSKKPTKSCSYRVIGLTTKLIEIKQIKNTHNKIGDFYNKHIPDNYMYSSFEQRLSLLQGLMDTDGHCDKNGHCEFVQVREELSKQVYELVLSLGIKATMIKRESWRYDVRHKDKYRIRFRTDLPVFRMKRKLQRIKKLKNNNFKAIHRFIKNIEPIQSIPMRCITVDSESHLFLITKKCIPTHNTVDVLFYDEIQKMSALAVGNSAKTATKNQYGAVGDGVQVYFGTPLQRGSMFFDMWQDSTQQFFHLGCEKCKKHFPLFSQNSNDWEDTWLYGHTVRCAHCGFDQDKRDAVERGKWIGTRPLAESKYIGFHINQLYMPDFTKEKVINEKPENSSINTERTYQNEVLGNFWSGETGIISPDEIREICGDFERKFRNTILPDDNELTFLGIDIGAKNDLEQLMDNKKGVQVGQSYSTAVVIAVNGSGKISIEQAMKFKRNDFASKRELINSIMRKYSCNLAVMDLGFTGDLSEVLQTEYGDRFLSSQATHKVNNHIKYNDQVFPKVITFEKDFWIAEMYEQMRKGNIRFPLGSYEQIAWLIQHCTNMEIKPSMSRIGEVSPKYVKSGPNDGFMALLNAYLAYKFHITGGFSPKNPLTMNNMPKQKPPIVVGYLPGL